MIGAAWKNTEYCRISGNCSDQSGEWGKKGRKEEKAFGIDLEGARDEITWEQVWRRISESRVKEKQNNILGHVEKWQTARRMGPGMLTGRICI